MAEDNKIIAAIAGLVVVVILAGSLLVPVINDAQGNEQTITNDVSGVKAVYCNPLTSETQMTITIEYHDDKHGVYVDGIKVCDLENNADHLNMVIQTDKIVIYLGGHTAYLRYYGLSNDGDRDVIVGPTSGEEEILSITINGFNVTLGARWFGNDSNPIDKTEVVSSGYAITDAEKGTYANVDVRSALNKSYSTIGDFAWGGLALLGAGSTVIGLPAEMEYAVTGDYTSKDGINTITFASNYDYSTETQQGTGAGFYVTFFGPSPDKNVNIPITNIIVPLSLTVGVGGMPGANILVVVPVILFAAVLVGAAAWVIRDRY